MNDVLGLVWPVFWDILGHDFTPTERRILLVVWAESLAQGQPAARFERLFQPALGLRTREAKSALSALERAGALAWDASTTTASILPNSEGRQWAVRRLAVTPQPDGEQALLLPSDRPLSAALADVAQADGLNRLRGSPAAAATMRAAAAPAAEAKALAKASEIFKASAKAGNGGGRNLEAAQRVTERVRTAIGRKAWDQFGREWLRHITADPAYFERLVSDCEARLRLGTIKSAGGWMSRIARDEGKWTPVQTSAQARV